MNKSRTNQHIDVQQRRADRHAKQVQMERDNHRINQRPPRFVAEDDDEDKFEVLTGRNHRRF